MLDYTFKITQTGDNLHIKGKVKTLIDAFELSHVKLGKVENGIAIIFADVRQRDRVNIFSSGLIEVDVSFNIPHKISKIHLVVNSRFDAWFDVVQA